jgi:hypothetical protein
MAVCARLPDFFTFLQGALGPLVGSTIALVGVMYADKRNTRRLLLQQEFAARESERKRILDLKKEIYVPIAGAIAHLNEYLLSLGTKEQDAGVDAASAFGLEAAKFLVIAETDTAILANSLSADFSIAHMQLAVFAEQVQRVRKHARHYQEYREKALEQCDRVTLELDKFFESAVSNDQLLDALQRARKHHHDLAQHYWKMEADALGQLVAQMQSYLQKALSFLAPLIAPSVDLLVALRRELGQETDRQALLEEMQGSQDRVIQYVDNLITGIGAQRERDQQLVCEDKSARDAASPGDGTS